MRNITKEEIQNIILKHYDFPFDMAICKIAENVIDRIDFKEMINKFEYTEEYEHCVNEIDIVNEYICQAIDDELIYTEDLWEIAKFYSLNPCELDWQQVMQDFYFDLYDIVGTIYGKMLYIVGV